MSRVFGSVALAVKIHISSEQIRRLLSLDGSWSKSYSSEGKEFEIPFASAIDSRGFIEEVKNHVIF